MNPQPVPEKAQAQRPWGRLVDFGPPRGHGETAGLEDCGHLPVLVDKTSGLGLPVCRSYWQPSEDDIARLQAGEPVMLAVWGQQVPVDVQVGY